VLSTACGIFGTPGNDLLVGTPADDVICGRGGDDTLEGGGGDDLLVGGPGDDRLSGGPGDDCSVGGPGEDEFDDDAEAVDPDSKAGSDDGSPSDRFDACFPDLPSTGSAAPPQAGEGVVADIEVSAPVRAGGLYVALVRALQAQAAEGDSSAAALVDAPDGKAHLHDGVVRVLLECSGTVTGTLTLAVDRRSGAPQRLGRDTFSCSAGGSAVVAIKLSPAAARVVAQLDRRALVATLVTHDRAGQRKVGRLDLSVARS
jgi:Ca2+-binding RTX toxin-like protein